MKRYTKKELMNLPLKDLKKIGQELKIRGRTSWTAQMKDEISDKILALQDPTPEDIEVREEISRRVETPEEIEEVFQEFIDIKIEEQDIEDKQLYTKTLLVRLPMKFIKEIGKELKIKRTSSWNEDTKEEAIDEILNVQAGLSRDARKKVAHRAKELKEKYEVWFTADTLSEMNLTRLKEIGAMFGIKGRSKWVLKNRISIAKQILDAQSKIDKPVHTVDELTDMTAKELKKVGRDLNIPKINEYRREEVIDTILETQIPSKELPNKTIVVTFFPEDFDDMPPEVYNYLVRVKRVIPPRVKQVQQDMETDITPHDDEEISRAMASEMEKDIRNLERVSFIRSAGGISSPPKGSPPPPPSSPPRGSPPPPPPSSPPRGSPPPPPPSSPPRGSPPPPPPSLPPSPRRRSRTPKGISSPLRSDNFDAKPDYGDYVESLTPAPIRLSDTTDDSSIYYRDISHIPTVVPTRKIERINDIYREPTVAPKKVMRINEKSNERIYDQEERRFEVTSDHREMLGLESENDKVKDNVVGGILYEDEEVEDNIVDVVQREVGDDDEEEDEEEPKIYDVMDESYIEKAAEIMKNSESTVFLKKLPTVQRDIRKCLGLI